MLGIYITYFRPCASSHLFVLHLVGQVAVQLERVFLFESGLVCYLMCGTSSASKSFLDPVVSHAVYCNHLLGTTSVCHHSKILHYAYIARPSEKVHHREEEKILYRYLSAFLVFVFLSSSSQPIAPFRNGI